MADLPLTPEMEDLAAELALGVLDGEERAWALRLSLENPGFAKLVEQWQLDLAPLLLEIPEVPAPDHVWPAIAARVQTDAAPVASLDTLRKWRIGAIGSGALAASLALALLLRPAPQPVPPRGAIAVSQLASKDGKASLTISYDQANGTLRVEKSALATATRQPELWIIPKDGVPRSLGLIAAGGEVRPVDPAMRPFIAQDAVFAITMEDPASAPHKGPNSPAILTGKISLI